jgi:hypothetical protein
MANAVLRPGADSSALRVVALLAGSGHGLGWLSVSPGIGTALLAALGLDAVMVGLAAAAIFTFRRVPGRAAMAYAAGVLAVAFGLAAWSSPAAWSVEPVLDASRLPTAHDEGSGASASRRLAPQAQETPVQSFVAVGAFEVRNEGLLRARDLAATLGLEARDEIPIAAQPDIKAAAAELIRGAQVLEVNGAEVVAAIDRVDFMVVETQGVLPRQVPVVENVDGAYIGVTLSTLTPRTPTTVSWTWTDFSIAAEIPVTLTDPEISRATTLSADSATLRWNNQLSEDPVPTVDAIRVEPTRAALPLLSIVLLGGAVALLWARRRDAHGTVLLRVSLVGALLVAPLGDIPVALPFTRAPTEGQARRILAGVLPNVYRALEFRDEAAAYDRLEISITGETLSDIYLEHRRALEMEERGGARARVEAVEVVAARDVGATAEGFEAEATWTVSGTVTHFGHRHFRQNRYAARIAVVPVDGTWRIRSIDILDERRLQ